MKLNYVPWFETVAAFFNLPLVLIGGALLCVAPMTAAAESVTFAGAERGIITDYSPAGIALDNNGNLFVADFDDGTVVEILAINGSIPLAPITKTLASGFGSGIQGEGYTGPSGIAVDAKGNIFVTDPNNNAVKEIIAVNGGIPSNPTIETLGSGFGAPLGIAVDASGNVFVADTGNDAVKEILAVNGSIPSNPTIKTLGNGFYFRSPQGVAVDTKGNVYVADTLNSAVREILAVDGSVKTLNQGYFEPFSIAVDANGDVYYANDSAIDTVQEILAVNGSIPTDPTIENIVNDLGTVASVALDQWGNVFFVHNVEYFNYYATYELQKQSVDFEDVQVCPWFSPCNYSLTLNYNVAPETTIGSVKVLTQGAANLDFQLEANDTSTTLCSAQTYSSATTCTVDVTFAPLYPGTRNGAVQILDGSGNVLATTPINGIGLAPELTFQPGSQSKLGSGLSFPNGVAVDASGNVFVADTGHNAVRAFLAAGGYSTVETLGSGFNNPDAVALDGSGNVFVADQVNNAVKEILAASGYTKVVNLGSGFSEPTGVAVDGSGNVFVADSGNSAVKEILAAGDYSTVSTLATGLSDIWGIAVDANENVYVAEIFANSVKQLIAASGYTTINTLGSGFNFPYGVAVDGIGNVYISELGVNQAAGSVFEILESGGYTKVNSLGSGFSGPQGIAVDQKGNVYVADTGNNRIEKLDFADAPPLHFAATPVGSTSSNSPQSIQFQNIGNAALTGTGALSDSTDFTVVTGSGAVPDCNPETLSLAPGVECNLSFSFIPQSAGSHSAVLTLSDNSLNGNPATQTVQLSGTGVATTPQAQLSTTTLNFGSLLSGTTEALPLTITNIGGGTLTVSPSITALSYKITGGNCTGGVTAGKSCTLQVAFDPISIATHDDILTLQTNGPSNPTVSLRGVGTGLTVSGGPLNFGAVPYGSSAILTLTITNHGVPGTIMEGTASFTGPSYSIVTTAQNSCLAGVTDGHSCTLPVEFRPDSVGAHNGLLTLTPTGGVAPITVSLIGSSTGLTASAYTLKFGTIAFGSTSTLSLTITNSGLPGTIMLGTVLTGHSYKVLTTSQNTCLAGITAGHSCTLPVEFDPTSTGNHVDFLTLTPSSGESAIQIGLEGTATP